MRATLDARALKPFTKALHCLSKYGDDLTMHATDECLTLSTTNSSMSAYCRFKYERQFFNKYTLGSHGSTFGETQGATNVTGQLLTKSLLSILRHKTVEKTVDRCELSIIEGKESDENNEGEDEDSLESRLTVRLHCKHGIVKTHRLILQTPSAMMAPGSPDTDNESHLTIGPRAVKDMLEHFPVARGTKSDPQLVWSFKDTEVEVKSLETSLDTKGRSQLSTELSLSADEFDLYDVYSCPTTIAFHLREFIATIAFAESLGLALDIRFTDPANPLFIDVESDLTETLFVISTSQVPGQPFQPSQAQPLNNRSNKREREGDAAEHPNKYKKPMRAAQRDPVPSARASSSTPLPQSRRVNSQAYEMPCTPGPSNLPEIPRRDPLFLPTSSQLSVAEEAAIRSSGLGIEDMDRATFEAMMDGDAEEIGPDLAKSQEATFTLRTEQPDSFELVEDVEMAPSQSDSITSRASHKGFKPLFED
ncbi:hypothetical protein EYR40_006627 [Pleurotus pulmonarius]|nr:hypothetical protein EYR36_011248 [Pleurotus pulmonarius]KAF4598274.1 hypothetical protein EYR38_006670 [Pleurotus pulmonarius]KAF4599533.1 hypothetical protein EYR40_006627 [Pleurotus pulmonarius]